MTNPYDALVKLVFKLSAISSKVSGTNELANPYVNQAKQQASVDINLNLCDMINRLFLLKKHLRREN